MSETITFNLVSGTLVVAPERIEYRKQEIRVEGGTVVVSPDRYITKEILTSDMQWMRFDATTTVMKSGGVKVHTYDSRAYLEIGRPGSKIHLFFLDQGTSTTSLQQFAEVCSVALRYYGPPILRLILGAMARGEIVQIGRFRFSTQGVEMPATKLLLFSGAPQTVPWERVKSSSGGASVKLADSAHANVHGEEPYYIANACLIPHLVQYVSAPRYVMRGDSPKMGPFAWAQLIQMASGGLLQPDDLVVQEGSEDGSPAAAIPGLFPTGPRPAPLPAWGVRPKAGDYFRVVMFTSSEAYIYGKCTKNWMGDVVHLTYAPRGDPNGSPIPVSDKHMFEVISEEEFEKARQAGFPPPASGSGA